MQYKHYQSPSKLCLSDWVSDILMTIWTTFILITRLTNAKLQYSTVPYSTLYKLVQSCIVRYTHTIQYTVRYTMRYAVPYAKVWTTLYRVCIQKILDQMTLDQITSDQLTGTRYHLQHGNSNDILYPFLAFGDEMEVKNIDTNRQQMVKLAYWDHVDDTRLSVRNLIDCYKVMFYNSREGRSLVPLDWDRKNFGWFCPVLVVMGGATRRDATVGSLAGRKHDLRAVTRHLTEILSSFWTFVIFFILLRPNCHLKSS